MYDTYQHKIAECDRELEATLKQFAAPERASTEQPKIPNAKKTKRIQRNAPGFNLTSELHRITGVDLSRIDGVNAIVAQTIISEVGLDMAPVCSVKFSLSGVHFCKLFTKILILRTQASAFLS
jgi:transposase